jgi:formylglycine-generating enzyme required for sulfatase activity
MSRVVFTVGVAALLGSLAVSAHAVTIDMVTVGDPGNTADTSPAGYGAVAAAFQIMKYEFTNQQYTDFLNSVAATDTYSFYNTSMGSEARGGITRSGSSGSYTYSVKSNMGDKPVIYVSWFDAARVSNWLMNGATSTSSTETGAYTLIGGQTSGKAPAVNSDATYYIPTENQWYKAAYYKGGSTNAGYWDYAMQSNSHPTAVTSGSTGIGSAGNTGNFTNFNNTADWNGRDGNVTTVGTNGGPSYYGAFDMTGNVWEWNDLTGAADFVRGQRGGSWYFMDAYVSSYYRDTFEPWEEINDVGFRVASVPEPSTYAMALAGLACGGYSMWRRRKRVSSYRLLMLAAIVTVTVSTAATPVFAQSVNYELVPVGDAGNANDPATGGIYGRVAYDYQIGKYDVTIGQYTDFLNAVAKTDTYSLYNAGMGTDQNIRGISRTGVSGSYSYSVIGPSGTTPAGASSPANRPITYVTWWDSARFANWMANNQPTGAQTSTTTENGAYNLANWTSGTAPARNVTNPNTGATPTHVIPTENEWYKAAYYDPTLSGTGGYYAYATKSNDAPGNIIGSGSNQANYNNGVYSVTQSASYSASQNYLTDVGAFSASGSFYGTFDQSGNVFQWNDLNGTPGSSRGLRGGSWNINASSLSSSFRAPNAPSVKNSNFGFRLASPFAVPEPSTYAMALAGLACGGYSLFHRRKRA